MAARSVSRIYDEAFRPLGIKGTQFSLLIAIKQAGPRSISFLADKLAMERTTLTRNVRVLENRGLVEVAAEGYRRSRELSLTREGEALLEKALPVWRATQEQVIARLGAEDWDKAGALLDRLAALG